MDETWLPVVGYEGLYEVSNMGRVRSLGSQSGWSRWIYYEGGILNGCIVKKSGYVQVELHKNCKGRTILVHKLVAHAFHAATYKPGLEVCHNNGIRSDNGADNLRWDTRKGNAADMARHGTLQKGSKHPNCRLSDADISVIAASSEPIMSLVRRFKTSHQTVRRIKLELNGQYSSLRTHCSRGHKYNDKNARTRKSGARECRICRRLRRSGLSERTGDMK